LPTEHSEPVQSPKSRRQAETGDAGYASRVSRSILHNTKLISAMTCGSVERHDVRVGMIVEN
jgi:hypothetical protein